VAHTPVSKLSGITLTDKYVQSGVHLPIQLKQRFWNKDLVVLHTFGFHNGTELAPKDGSSEEEEQEEADKVRAYSKTLYY